MAHVAAPQYYAIVDFDASGYVADPVMLEQQKRDLLASFQAGDEEVNAVRRANGWSEIATGDWIHEPSYDAAARQRAWAVATRESGPQGDVTLAANLGLQVFGKDGFVRARAACKPEDAEAVLADLGAVFRGFSFNSGLAYEAHAPVAQPDFTASREAAAKEKRLYTLVLLLVLATPFILGTIYVLATGKHKRPTPPPTPPSA